MWKQVQLIPAYALTAHKGQGLTLSMTFLGLDDIFGFGLAYTMYTRSRFAENMYNVGVPPRDILEALLRRDSDGQNAIDRKRLEVLKMINDTNAFDAVVDARIQSGEFSLKTIAMELGIENEPILANARAKLREVLLEDYKDCAERLTTTKGLEAMCKVNQWGYSFKEKGIYVWKNNTWWKTLAGTLQADD